jgi:hypothetical protein
MFRVGLSILLYFTALLTAAQTSDSSAITILHAHSFKEGIYKTFWEFKHNSPTLLHPFLYDGKNLWRTDSANTKLAKINRENVWGFCDGKQVYIRWKKFNVITEVGRFCYFQESGTRLLLGIAPFPLMILPLPMPYVDELIVSFNTGKVYVLTKKVLRTLLRENDKPLLAEFEREKQKKKKLHLYIVKYNERNEHRIR